MAELGGEGWVHREGSVGEVRLHWVEAGEGPLVVLLHGFPETWRCWRRQIPALVEAGFRVAAPDLRGYGRSEKPKGSRAYTRDRLVADVVGLVRALGAERAHLAGHDWGGIVSWYTAMHHPELVDRLVVANAPHPAVFRRELLRPRQFLRSWYGMFFQLPRLPEAALRANGFAALERIFRKSPRRPGAYTDEDIRAYREAAAQRGALTAMVNYYRAIKWDRIELCPIERPALLVWGERDRALDIHNLEGVDRWVRDLRVERIPEASHWVLADAPERISGAMVRHLRGDA